MSDSFAPNRRTLIAIRCVEYSEAVRQVALDMQIFFPDAGIVFVSDQRSRVQEFPPGVDVIPITKHKLDSLGLFHARENVGWVCGDYCYYLTLDMDWDFLWLVEADVAFTGDAGAIMREVNSTNVDLIGTRIGERHFSWPWAPRLLAASDITSARGVFFPLTRVSRKLAEAALAHRQRISSVLIANETLLVPNDEVVIASTAHAMGMDHTDLQAAYPEAFQKWNWLVRYCRDELGSGVAPQFVHPAHEREDFVQRLSSGLAKALDAPGLLGSLAGASEQLRSAVLHSALKAARS